MQLAAVGPSNIYFNRNNNDIYSEGYSCIKFNNNNLTIDRNGDTCIPLYIKSDKEIKNIELRINCHIINKIPLEFCNKLYGHEIKKDNYFLYKIPWNLMFEKDLYILKVRTKIDIIIESENICDAELYLKYKYLNLQSRRSLYDNDKISFMKNFQWQNYIIKEGQSRNKINFEGLIKGLFIENIDISKIKSLGIQINRVNRLNYNKTMIDLFVKKIGNDIVYINLDDSNNKFDDYIFTSSLNFSRINEVHINIDTEIDQNIRILSLSANCLMYNNIITVLRYPYNNIPEYIIKKIEKFIKKQLEGDKLCPIGYDEINNGDHYMNCVTCKKNFNPYNLKTWLEKSYTCPHCRSKWQDNKIYVNEINV